MLSQLPDPRIQPSLFLPWIIKKLRASNRRPYRDVCNFFNNLRMVRTACWLPDRTVTHDDPEAEAGRGSSLAKICSGISSNRPPDTSPAIPAGGCGWKLSNLKAGPCRAIERRRMGFRPCRLI